MKNKEVCEKFAQGIMKTDRNKNLFVENGVLYSYGYHYPLCIKLFDGYVINKDGYSMSTETHSTHLIRSITGYDTFKEFLNSYHAGEFILCDTQKMKDIVNDLEQNNVQSINDLIPIDVIKEL